MGLKTYRQKRDFKQTAEPAGSKPRSRLPDHQFFVVQKHAASRLHYDFRLEMDGVLKSWAVPKGFPYQKGERRLAMHVEDHPIEYANFEGTIPPGNYGAGTVMVWDRGPYQVLGETPAEAYAQGKIHLTLSGKKLHGDWTLVRIRNPRDEVKDQWLLLKSGEAAPTVSNRADDQSVITKRSLAQIAKANDAEWQSNRPAAGAAEPREKRTARRKTITRLRPAPSKRSSPLAPDLGNALKKLPRATPGFVDPMKALLVERLPTGPQWIYEVKFDGYRALAVKTKDQLSLISRSGKSLTDRYAPVAEALKRLSAKAAVLDGEIVAVDAEGRSSFQLLQSYQSPTGRGKPPLVYYVFDLLNLEGRDLTKVPLLTRKQWLRELLKDMPEAIRFSASLEAEPKRLIKEMKRRGLEGLLAKLEGSPYEIGLRSGAWVKFKWSNEQEFVIGGYTPPKGGRTDFGAILVGYYEGDQLRFASKVGSGFDAKQLRSLHTCFDKFAQAACPFVNLPERLPSGLGAAEMRTCQWLQPELVCQVRFTEWTRDRHLRHPLFLGLREDKPAREVVREKPV